MEYKVTFQDNKPVSAVLMKVLVGEKLIDLTRSGNRRLMNWLVVEGDDEKDALKMAENIVREYWAKYLSKVFS
jgi:hypothetical protein